LLKHFKEMIDMKKGSTVAALAAASIMIVATGCSVEEDNPPATNTVVHDQVPGPSTHTETHTVTPGASTNTVTTPGGSSTTVSPGGGAGTTTTTTGG